MSYMENLGKTGYKALDLEESSPLERNQLLISLLLIIVKASLKNDLAILLDLLLDDSLPISIISRMILLGLRKKWIT
mgnify:CR=1 FL=1